LYEIVNQFNHEYSRFFDPTTDAGHQGTPKADALATAD
jgi:hypothetical protein